MTKAVRDRTLARSSIASEVIAPYLDRFFEWPALAIPDPSDITSPSEAASELRILWGLGTGPIDNMVHLLEAKGVRVFWISEESSSVDAFAYWKEDRPFVFLNVAKDSGERSRFDAAHELGHLILHREVPLDELNDRRESEANEFASSFLLPAEGFGPECPSTGNIKSFLPLKERWGTSAQAMVRRARALGILSQWQYDESWRLASMYGWRSGKEPQSLNLERSSLHFKMLDAFKDSGVASEEILSALALPQDIFDELIPEAKAFYRHSFEPLNGWMVV
ncbi:ImmA/IrrE family metallo-endopeptidase [Phormidesmis sp. 146-12]